MPRNDPNCVPTRFLNCTGVELLAPKRLERLGESRGQHPLVSHTIQTTEASDRSRMDGTHIVRKTRKRSLSKLFKHVRVGIHEVNSDIDSALRLLRRLNDHPRPVVLDGS